MLVVPPGAAIIEASIEVPARRLYGGTDAVNWAIESSINRKATQKASVGGWTGLRLAANLEDRSKSVILFDNKAKMESGRTVDTFEDCLTPKDRTDAYSLSLTFPCRIN